MAFGRTIITVDDFVHEAMKHFVGDETSKIKMERMIRDTMSVKIDMSRVPEEYKKFLPR